MGIESPDEGRERGRFKLIGDFYRMSPEEEEIFRQEVEKAEGKIIIFMHPFYNLHNTAKTISPEHLRFVKRVNDAVQSTLETEGPPALIMEEAPNLIKMEYSLKPMRMARVAAVAATHDDLSIPFLINGIKEQHRFPSSWHVVQEEWQRFLQKLKDLGVKEVEINGSFLWANGKPGAGEMDTGCVGGMIDKLAGAGIKIKIGETNPDSREIIEKMPETAFRQYL